MNLKELEIILNKSIHKVKQEDRKLFDIDKKCDQITIIKKIYDYLLKEHSKDFTLKFIAKNTSKLSFRRFLNSIINEIELDFKDKIHLVVAFYRNELNYCKMCGKPTLHTYCSSFCSNHDEDVKNKIRKSLTNTLEERYGKGIRSTQQIKEINDKSRKTSLEKYGSEYYGNLEKGKETRKLKYNDENYNNSKKNKETRLRNNDGVYWTNEQLEKTYKTKELRYGDSKFVNVEKRIKFCKENYTPIDNPNTKHYKNKENLNKEYILENFVKDKEFLFDDFLEYFNCCKNAGHKIKEYLGINIQNKQKSISQQEKELFEWIPIENKIQTDRIEISPLELDIYLPDYKLAIEYNGSYWHSEIYKDSNYHLNKTKLCKEKGIDLIHVFDFDDLEIVKSMILNKLGLNKRMHARKCKIKEIENVEFFLEENDLNGTCDTTFNLGLFYENELVQVMCFKENEIVRMCTKKYLNVVGGISKLLKHSNLKSIKIQIDRRFSNENTFIKLGFKLIKETEPNYLIYNTVKVYDCGKLILEK